MSVISNRHQFVPFVSGTSKPYHEQRLAKVGYKKVSKKQSVCVSIPRLSDDDVAFVSAAYPVEARKRVEDFQDSLVRSLYESGKSEIDSSELSREQLCQFLAAESTAGRLSAAVVADWWNGEFQEIAAPVLSDKYGTEDEEILAKKAKLWGDAFAMICGNSAVDIARLKQLANMCEFVDSDDAVGMRIRTKIAGMIAESEALEAL